VNSKASPVRRLFLESLLVSAEAEVRGPDASYDEARDLTVLADGTPLVERVGGLDTATFTKSEGERGDADEPESAGGPIAGTLTSTAVNAERDDHDGAYAWGDTQLETRRIPRDVDRD
jgi:hypothetical protein